MGRYGRDDKQVVVWGQITMLMSLKFMLEGMGSHQKTHKWVSNYAVVLPIEILIGM